MLRQHIQITFISVTLFVLAPAVSRAQHCPLDIYRPACGKVCKLVCEPKKLVSIGYGSDCKQICVPGPSEPGCQHCACCCGERKCEPCVCCEPTAPLFKFCWRDWYPCCCAQPRNVKVLTKYQLEKKVRWYHWEVVDASCCKPACTIDDTTSKHAIAGSADAPAVIKPAPQNANIGDSLPVSIDERAKLATLFNLSENELVANPRIASARD
jgi:hypothetical protein